MQIIQTNRHKEDFAMKRILSILICLSFLLLLVPNLWAWDDKVTHKDLSKIAAQKSNLADDSYIKNIGYEEGLVLVQDTGATNPNSTIPRWIEHIKNGARDEDYSTSWTLLTQTSPFYNHFHNPLTNTGLDDYVFVIDHVTGQSSIDWAQDSFNEWSWQKVRDYYFGALTSQTATDRNTNFGKTFKGVGHIIHLIQDAAQPAHTRNEWHIMKGGLSICIKRFS